MDTKQQLINALVGLGSTITETMDEIEGFVPCGHPALVVTAAINAISDNVDDAALTEQLETVSGFIDHVAEHRGVTAYHGLDIELAESATELFNEIRTVAALMKTAGVKNVQANEWLYRSLAAIRQGKQTIKTQLDQTEAIKATLK